MPPTNTIKASWDAKSVSAPGSVLPDRAACSCKHEMRCHAYFGCQMPQCDCLFSTKIDQGPRRFSLQAMIVLLSIWAAVCFAAGWLASMNR